MDEISLSHCDRIRTIAIISILTLLMINIFSQVRHFPNQSTLNTSNLSGSMTYNTRLDSKSSWLISIKLCMYAFRMQFQMLEKFFDV